MIDNLFSLKTFQWQRKHQDEKSLKIPPEAVNQESTDNKCQSKKNKAANNDLQNTTHKTEQHESQSKANVNSDDQEGYPVHAPLVVLVIC